MKLLRLAFGAVYVHMHMKSISNSKHTKCSGKHISRATTAIETDFHLLLKTILYLIETSFKAINRECMGDNFM